MATAAAGGVLLLAIVLLVCLSVLGRSMGWAGLGPVPGDSELVAVASAVAVFCFLPWCQLQRGHVTVDIAVVRLPRRGRAALAALGDLAILAIYLLLAGQTVAGLLSKLRFGEATFILRLPIWWAYAGCAAAAAVGALVAVYALLRSVMALRAA